MTETSADRLYDAEMPMADGEVPMTAAENVLAWLVIEKIGVPDDVSYTPSQAREAIVRRLDRASELDKIDERLMDGQGGDDGNLILPEFGRGWSVYAKIEACLHILERRRDTMSFRDKDVLALRDAARKLADVADGVGKTHNVGLMDDDIAAVRAVLDKEPQKTAIASPWRSMDTAPRTHSAKIMGSYDDGGEVIQLLYYSTFDWKWRRKLDGVVVPEPKAWLPYPQSRHEESANG
ncbi:hypothetical protein GOB57_08150 [Sinorhizobium meliloti]|nr:hypothetical protein [Sinorhizobium meliloti]